MVVIVSIRLHLGYHTGLLFLTNTNLLFSELEPRLA